MTPKRRLTITSVIAAGFACVLILAAAGTWYSLSGLDRMRGISRDLYEHPFAVSNAAAELKGALFQLRNYMLQVVVIRNPGDNLGDLSKNMEVCDKTIRGDLDIIRRFFLGDTSRVTAMETELDEWTQIRKEILRHVAAGDMTAAEQLVKTVGTPKFNQITPHLEYILNFALDKGRYFADEAERQAAEIQRQVAAIAFALGCLLAISSYVVIWRVRYLHSELDQLATVDFLTGLPNRRRFMEQAESEMARSARYKQPFAMAILDIDFFKKVNDQYGHSAGDAVLKAFSAVCLETLRDSDFVGRIGGEEFAVLFPNTSLPEASKVLERLRSRIAETVVVVAGNQKINITASFGVAVVSEHSDEIDPLFQLADQALYEAKEKGRNRVCTRAA